MRDFRCAFSLRDIMFTGLVVSSRKLSKAAAKQYDTCAASPAQTSEVLLEAILLRFIRYSAMPAVA